MVTVEDLLRELCAQPRVTTTMLNLLSAWAAAELEARGPSFGLSDDTWEADVDLAACSGYLAVLQDKVTGGGPTDPVLTVADVRAFVGHPEYRCYLPSATALLLRTAQHKRGSRQWPAPVIGTTEDVLALHDEVDRAIDDGAI